MKAIWQVLAIIAVIAYFWAGGDASKIKKSFRGVGGMFASKPQAHQVSTGGLLDPDNVVIKNGNTVNVTDKRGHSRQFCQERYNQLIAEQAINQGYKTSRALTIAQEKAEFPPEEEGITWFWEQSDENGNFPGDKEVSAFGNMADDGFVEGIHFYKKSDGTCWSLPERYLLKKCPAVAQ